VLAALLVALGGMPLFGPRCGEAPGAGGAWRCAMPVVVAGNVERGGVACAAGDGLARAIVAAGPRCVLPDRMVVPSLGGGDVRLYRVTVRGAPGTPCRFDVGGDPGLAALLFGRAVAPGELEPRALAGLPHVGPKLAARIQAFFRVRPSLARRTGPEAWRPALRVRGLGPKRIGALVRGTRPYRPP
jgi:hypothetical protein